MANQADELAFANRKIEVLHDHRRAGRCRIGLRQLREFEISAHDPTSTISFLISCRRTGAFRRLRTLRGTDRSSGSMSGKTIFFITAVRWRAPLPSREFSTSRRVFFKRGSWLMGLRSRGPGISIGD